MPSFFIYNLGPVQDFIATAKRCRDLWFGSWMLSELSKAAARAVAEQPGVGHEALIFPHVADPGDLAADTSMSVANKIVARLPDGVAPGEVAGACRRAVASRLRVLRDAALGDIHRDTSRHLQRPLADRQIDDLIEAQWVSVPFAPERYADARAEAEALLRSAKQTRLWGPVPWPPAHQPKSSLDGLRESVIDPAVHGTARGDESMRGRLGLDDGEHLCGVGMLKRHGKRRVPGDPDAHRFFSTPHLAARPLLDRMSKLDAETRQRVEQRWRAYLGALEAEGACLDETVPARWREPILGRHDGQLLYAGRVAERLEHLDEVARRRAVTRVLPALHALLDALGAGGDPPPYIAVLVADGDRMGDAIVRRRSPEDHRALSAALDGFARGARQIVEEARGQLIYAGGDDVLAFVPVHRALSCAQELRLRFNKALAEFSEHGPLTLSVGLGISHFMEPMTQSLAVARRAEKLAKRDRDSLAVIVDKRSGAPVCVSGKWDELDVALETLIDLHIRDEVPDKLGHDLEALNHLQATSSAEDRDILADIVAHEFAHLLGHKRSHRGDRPLSGTTRGHLIGPRPTAVDPTKIAPSPELAARLIVARLFARARQVAAPEMSS